MNFLVRVDIQRTKVFQEFTQEEQEKYFSLANYKTVHNIDTLYYAAFLDEENEKGIEEMVKFFAELKDRAQAGEREIQVLQFEFVPVRFSIYEYCLRLENMYDIFFGKYLPNSETPRVVVQCRSIGLWLDGALSLVKASHRALQAFLAVYGVEVLRLSENRIDYAYHTNMIQSTTKYFSDKNMLRSLRSQLEIYHKVGEIGREITVEYLSLGQRKSNNVFFRAYNKTREVIEKNYKGFFIDLWHKHRLISDYDKYCLESAYKSGTYNGLMLARIEWYLEHGRNDYIKEDLRALKRSCYENSDNAKHIAEKLSGLLPEVTVIVNIEYQTKRKFYRTLDDFIANTLTSSVSADSVYDRLFRILENPKPFLDYLTKDMVSFRCGDDFASWWRRLRSVKLKSRYSGDLYREYARNLDIEKLKQRLAGTVAATSIYRSKGQNLNNQDFTADLSDMLCVLNDNDVAFVDTGTGELLHYDCVKNYGAVKRRKARQIKAFLEGDESE